MLLCQQMALAAVADMLRVHDTLLWRIVAHYVEEAQARRSWAGVRNILVDETSARKRTRVSPCI